MVKLVILMRNDMNSLNAGKACAQATHAANEAVHFLKKDYKTIYEEWIVGDYNNSYLHFGTVTVLDGTFDEIRGELEIVTNDNHWTTDTISFGWILDPTYPLDDGGTTHYFPAFTCAWVWVINDEYKFGLGLMP